MKKVKCPKCGRVVTCKEEQAGEVIRCPHAECSGQFRLKSPTQMPKAKSQHATFPGDARPAPPRQANPESPVGKSSARLHEPDIVRSDPSLERFKTARRKSPSQMLLLLGGAAVVFTLLVLVVGALSFSGIISMNGFAGVDEFPKVDAPAPSAPIVGNLLKGTYFRSPSVTILVNFDGHTTTWSSDSGETYFCLTFDCSDSTSITPSDYMLISKAGEKYRAGAISFGSDEKWIALSHQVTSSTLGIKRGDSTGSVMIGNAKDKHGTLMAMIVGGVVDIPRVNLLYMVPESAELMFVHGKIREKVTP